MHQQRRDPLEGAVVDRRYLVHSRLARGGMSTVYLATDRRLDRRVALKVLYPHLAEEPGFVERFEQEAKSAARLSHPNVVGVLDQGVDDVAEQTVAYLVMEFVEGRTLRDVLREEGRLTPGRALHYLEDVVKGLAAAHEAGLIHRDVKPENVLLSRTGQVKIADFGLARAISATTGTATLVGTAAYLSPELVMGRPAEAQSDIYSTGIMLYELLTGVQPFTGELPVQIAFQHVQSEVPAPSVLLPGLAADIDELVLQCTAHDPEHRPIDGTALLGELQHLRSTLDAGELEYQPRDTRYELADQDQLTVGAVPRIPTADSRTETLTGDSSEAPTALPAGAPTEAPEHLRGNGRDRINGGRHGATALRLPDDPGPRAPGGTRDAADSRTGFIMRDHSATRVFGALSSVPGAPPSSAPGVTARLGSPAPVAGRSTEESDLPSPGEGAHTSLDASRVRGLQEDHRQQAGHARNSGAVARPLSRRQQAREAHRPHKTLQSRATRRLIRILVILLVLLAGLVVGVGLLLGSGPAGLVSLPDVANVPLSEARAVLNEEGLSSLSTEEVFHEEVLAGFVIGTDPGAFSDVRRYESVELIVSRGPELFAVPDLVGLGQVTAAAELGASGLAVGVVDEQYSETAGAGEVLSQSAPEGRELRGGTEVDLVVSLGPEPIPVPDVTGLAESEAVAALEAAGLEVAGADTTDYSLTVPAGAVITQSPSGVDVKRGTEVTLTLSLGPRLVEVPTVFSLSEARAVAALEEAGFVVEVEYTFGTSVLGLVAGQSLTGEQPEGSTISITVT